MTALDVQRPILAMIIAIDSPCVNLEHERMGPECSPLIQFEILWPLFMEQPSFKLSDSFQYSNTRSLLRQPQNLMYRPIG
jgi:hypothetical protein